MNSDFFPPLYLTQETKIDCVQVATKGRLKLCEALLSSVLYEFRWRFRTS